MIQHRIGRRFELIEQARTGGSSSVYRARDRATGHTVAVKILDADPKIDPRRVAREAQALAAVSAPGVARLIEHGATAAGQPYFVVEWLEGELLADRLAAGPLPRADAIRVAGEIALALGALHGLGIVHRDVKPGNIVLCPPPRGATLVDFGAAGIAGATRITTGGLGTPDYMAPEQAAGRPPDPRMDVYALGCVLWECLTGSRPPAGEVPADLAPLCERLLAVDVPIRPPDGNFVARALERVAGSDP